MQMSATKKYICSTNHTLRRVAEMAATIYDPACDIQLHWQTSWAKLS